RVGEDELYAVEPVDIFNLPAADGRWFTCEPVFQTCGDLGGQPYADACRDQFAEAAVKLIELLSERRPAYGDGLGGKEARDDAVLFGVMAPDGEPGRFFPAENDLAAVDELADELKADGRF